MELAELLNTLFKSYGAAALPWSVIAFLGWLVLKDRISKDRDTPNEYRHILDSYNEAIVDVTRALERLAVLLEERTRRGPPA